MADYYAETIGGPDPKISSQPHMLKMRELLQGLRTAMTLAPRQKPKPADVEEVNKVAKELVELARK